MGRFSELSEWALDETTGVLRRAERDFKTEEEGGYVMMESGGGNAI